MRGFLQKDIELLKQNRSFLGLVAVMVIFFVSVKNDAFIIIYLGMMGGFLSISTISYDEADRGMGFLMTLPAARKTIPYCENKIVRMACATPFPIFLALSEIMCTRDGSILGSTSPIFIPFVISTPV